jgi:hypothetical protein
MAKNKSKTTRVPIYEEFVQSCIVEHLKSKKLTRNVRVAKLHSVGIDIQSTHQKYNRDWIIECKGDSLNAASPGSSRQGSFHHVFGQIIKRMHSKGKLGYRYKNKYGVGLLASFRTLVIKNVPYDVCFKLTLSIFLVNAKGEVEELDYKKLRALQ